MLVFLLFFCCLHLLSRVNIGMIFASESVLRESDLYIFIASILKRVISQVKLYCIFETRVCM